MTGLPLRMVHGNLLVGHGPARAALYRVDCVSYPFLSAGDKRAWLRRLARLAHGLEADFSLYRVARAYPADAYAAQGASMLDARRQDPEAWRELLSGHESHLRRLRSWAPEVYLAVSLQARSTSALGGTLLGGFDRARRRLESALGVADAPIPDQEVDALLAEEERIHARVTACVPAHRVTAAEVQWLLRRTACRGVCEPVLDEHWQPGCGLVRHLNAPLVEEDRILVSDAEEARSHQAMLAIGALPEQTVFPGTAEIVMSPLEGVGFPADFVLHARRIDNRDALVRVRRRIVDADNAYAEQVASAHGPLSYVVEENRQLARELDAYLQATEQPPLLNVSMSVAVGADTRERLEERVQELRTAFGTVALHRPLGLQAALFADHLPRPDGGTVTDYADVLTVEQLAALMPVGTHTAGSRRGVLIGRTVTGGHRPIKFDITEASRAGRPPSILLAGTLGSGKTIAAQLLAYQAERRGSVVVDVDPKPDHNLEGLPELAGRVAVIDLAGDERYRGLLDPLVIAPTGLREDLAASYLTELLPQAPAGWETQIRKAVKAAIATDAPSCVRVLELLASSSNLDALAAGEALGVWAGSPIGGLAFSTGQSARESAELPVTTIKARGLALPSPGVPRADYDQAERLGVATLKLIAAYAMRLVGGDRSVHKVVLFDEAWFLLASRDGRRLIDRLNRLGRAENATLILATQQLSDVGEIENLIGTRLIFGQETAAEARRALELLGLDPDDRTLVERVRSYRKGRCLMRDITDQVAEVQIDPVAPHLLEVLDTTPKAGRAEVVA